MKDSILPVVCFGYHFQHYYSDDIPDITECSVPFSDTSVCRKEGWTTTRHIRFSPNKKVVWLCPECSKRWQEEKREILDHLLWCKKQLHEDYMNEMDVEKRSFISDVKLYSLRLEFIAYEPTNEDWVEWYKI